MAFQEEGRSQAAESREEMAFLAVGEASQAVVLEAVVVLEEMACRLLVDLAVAFQEEWESLEDHPQSSCGRGDREAVVQQDDQASQEVVAVLFENCEADYFRFVVAKYSVHVVDYPWSSPQLPSLCFRLCWCF